MAQGAELDNLHGTDVSVPVAFGFVTITIGSMLKDFLLTKRGK
jgi:hypothetical protein